MIESLVVGGLANVVSKYVGFREDKKRADIEMQKQEADHRRSVELMEIQNRLGLEIANKELIKAQVQAEVDKINAISANRKENASLDRILYTRMDKTIVNIIALMKPIITYSMLAVLILITVYGVLASYGRVEYEHYAKIVKLLNEMGILGLAEMTIGFWFGALGMDQMSKKK